MLITSCSVEKIASNYFLETLQQSEQNIRQSNNPYLIKEAMPALIVMLDNEISKSPEKLELLIQGAKMHTLYALLFLSEDNRWASLHYQQAKAYAIQAIKTHYDISIEDLSQQKSEVFSQKIQQLPKESLPCLYWLGVSWGNIVGLNRDKIEYLGQIPYVESLMKHAVSIEETFEDGMVYTFFGILYSDQPQATNHFEKALSLTQRQLYMVHLLYAKTYAVTSGNKKLFTDLLEEIVEGWQQQNFSSKFRLANAVAHDRAKNLLDDIDDFFPEDEEEDE